MRYPGNSHDLASEASKLGGKPITLCDYSGFLCNLKDTVKQMAYNGSGLYDTGYRVHKRYADKPNPQALTPPIKMDPKPILNVRYDSTSFGKQILDVIKLDITDFRQRIVTNWSPTASFVFSGPTTETTTVTFENTIFQLYFKNETPHPVIMTIAGHPFRNIMLEPSLDFFLISYNMIEFEIVL